MEERKIDNPEDFIAKAKAHAASRAGPCNCGNTTIMFQDKLLQFGAEVEPATATSSQGPAFLAGHCDRCGELRLFMPNMPK